MGNTPKHQRHVLFMARHCTTTHSSALSLVNIKFKYLQLVASMLCQFSATHMSLTPLFIVTVI